MNKSQLINDLAEQSQLSKVEVKHLVDTLFEKIESKLQEGEKVVLSGFGVFSVVNVAERVGRNPRTGEQVFQRNNRSESYNENRTRALHPLTDYTSSIFKWA